MEPCNHHRVCGYNIDSYTINGEIMAGLHCACHQPSCNEPPSSDDRKAAPAMRSPSLHLVEMYLGSPSKNRSICRCWANSATRTSRRDITRPHVPCPHGVISTPSPCSIEKRMPSRLSPQDHVARRTRRAKAPRSPLSSASVIGRVDSSQVEKQRRAAWRHTKSVSEG